MTHIREYFLPAARAARSQRIAMDSHPLLPTAGALQCIPVSCRQRLSRFILARRREDQFASPDADNSRCTNGAGAEKHCGCEVVRCVSCGQVFDRCA